MKRGNDEEHVSGTTKKISKQLDQYFTKPIVAETCVTFLQQHLKRPLETFDVILEPSYGEGAFVDAIRKNDKNLNMIFVDIASADDNHRADFLSEQFSVEKQGFLLTIGNPPFGKNSSTAVSFFNKAAAFSDVIAFILPRTFRKNSCKNRLDRRFFLVAEQILDQHSFLFEGKDYDVPCCFQVWSHVNFLQNFDIDNENLTQRPLFKKLSETDDFAFVKNSETCHFAIRRVGVNAGKLFDSNLDTKSKESHLFVRVLNEVRVAEVLCNLQSLGLEQVDCKFDTAGNPSLCKDEICRLYNNKYSKE